MLKLAHISDLHFFHLGKSPRQFFDKTFIGNWHYFINRRGHFSQPLAYQVIDCLKREGVTHLLITGDFTNSSSKKEMVLMRNYLSTLTDEGFRLFTLPGNHDVYTKAAVKSNRFFETAKEFIDFQGDIPPYNLIDHKVAAYRLLDNWWLLLIDAAIPTSLDKATGLFSQEIENSLKELLKILPREALLCVGSHFPLEKYKYPKAHLQRGDILSEILHTDPRVCLYLHGHRHIPRIEFDRDLLLVESGSLTLKAKSCFNLLNFTSNACEVRQFQFNSKSWEVTNVRQSTKRMV